MKELGFRPLFWPQRVESTAQGLLIAAGFERHVELAFVHVEAVQSRRLFRDVDRLVGADLQCLASG
jgi:hypothetical protein